MPSPDWMPKYIPVPDNETIMKAVYQVRNDAYTAAFANNGKLAQNVNATSMAAALEFAYEAAGLVAQTGTYKDEYKARIQYIKDTSVLPDGLKGLDANIYFATLDYADMTIGYYMNEAGEKVGKGYVKFKEKSVDVIKAMLDAIKDSNYWSKPFKNIDGNTYNNSKCFYNGNQSIGTFFSSPNYLYNVILHNSNSYVFRYEDNNMFVLSNDNTTKFSYTIVVRNLDTGEIDNRTYTYNWGDLYDNDSHLIPGIYKAGINKPGKCVSISCPLGDDRAIADLYCPKKGNINKYDTTQTGISFMPAVVPATVPTSGKSYVDTDIETYVDGYKKLKPNKEGQVEIPMDFPQEVPFPEFSPEVAPEVEPTPNPKPNPNPQPNPNTETDLDVPSAIGKLDLLDRFPFCVPSDLIQGIKLFNATPTTPTWSWNLSVNGTPIQYTWVVSLDKFEKIAQLCRTLLTILFVWGLAKVTRYVIKG